MHRFDTSAKGVYLITVTPFADDGPLDLASTDRMVDFCLERGVTGLTILGIMGEATKLTRRRVAHLLRSRCSARRRPRAGRRWRVGARLCRHARARRKP